MKNVILKRWCILLVALSCTLLCCACSPVSMQTKYYDSGAVETTVTIPTSSLKVLGESGYSIRVDRVYRILRHYTQDLKDAYDDRMVSLFSNLYTFPSTYSREDKLSYISIGNPNFTYEIGITPMENAYNVTSDTQNVVVSAKFASIYAYIMYFYPDALKYDEDSGNIVLDKDKMSLLIDVPVSNSSISTDVGFLTRTITQTATPFGYNGTDCTLLSPLIIGTKTYPAGERLYDVVQDALSISSEQMGLMFSFLSPYKRLHSDGATSYDDGYYVHTWTMHDTTGQVKIYREYANYSTWYILALIIGAVVLGGGMIIAKVIHNHRKRKGMVYMRKIADFVNANDAQSNINEVDDD